MSSEKHCKAPQLVTSGITLEFQREEPLVFNIKIGSYWNQRFLLLKRLYREASRSGSQSKTALSSHYSRCVEMKEIYWHWACSKVFVIPLGLIQCKFALCQYLVKSVIFQSRVASQGIVELGFGIPWKIIKCSLLQTLASKAVMKGCFLLNPSVPTQGVVNTCQTIHLRKFRMR